MVLREISEEFLNQIARDKRVSEGELAALKLALTKQKSKDIAQQLNISEAAARKRLGEVYRKFGIKGSGPGKLASLEKTLEIGYEQAQSSPAHSQTAHSPTEQHSHGEIHSAIARHHGAGWADSKTGTTYYWGSAPTLNAFAGRCQPLARLKEWILQPSEGTKLLAVCGIGGMGKTHLVRKLAEEVGSAFQTVVWLKVDKAKPPENVLRQLITTLQTNRSNNLPLRRLGSTQAPSIYPANEPIDKVIQQIVELMNKQQALVVLDRFDAAFKSYSAEARAEAGAETKAKIKVETEDKVEAEDKVKIKEPTDKTLTFHVNRKQQSSLYREGFGIYGKLLAAIKQSVGRSHSDQKSCLIVTSREKPQEILSFPVDDSRGKLYALEGLNYREATAMLERFHLAGDSEAYRALAERYCGHPMALRLAANTVKDIFYGSIQGFLDQKISVFDDLRGILKAQFNRLPPTEQEVMYWLAINIWPCSLESLQADIVAQDHQQNLLYTLRSLERRSLVQVNRPQGRASVTFQLHPIVAEYVLDRFIRAAFQDLVRGNLTLFNDYALMKADAEEDLRSLQIKTIVQPILVRLKNHYKSLNKVDKQLSSRLAAFRHDYPGRLGYAGGNFLNLLVQLSQGTLQKRDFSNLTIWQAYLQGTQMRDVNFNQCALNRSVFTETLSDVLAVALRRSGKMRLLCAGDTNGFVHLWHTSSGDRAGVRPDQGGEKQTEWLAHQSWVRAVAFVPNQPLLVTGGDDSELKLWRLPAASGLSAHQAAQTVEQIWQQSSKDRIYTVAVSPDGRIIASGGDDKITLYHTRTGQLLKYGLVDYRLQPEQAKPHNRVRSLTFSPDGQWLASGGDDHRVRLWSVKNILKQSQKIEPTAELKGHRDLVRAVVFSPDSTKLVSSGADESIIVWQVPDFERLRTLKNVGGNVRDLAISPDGSYLASGGDDAQVRLWDTETFACMATFSTQTSRVWSLDFQQQGDRLLLSAGGDKQRLMLWQIFKNESKTEIETDTSIESRLLRTYRGYTNSLRSVAYLGSSKIVGGGDSGDLSVWDTKTGDRTATLSLHHGRIWSVAVDIKNARIASASDDSTIRLWDATTGQCLTTLTGHSSWVRAVAFSRHGRFLASTGDDCTLRIWNPLSGGCLKILKGSDHWIHSVGFSPTSSRYVISGGDEKVVRRWDRKEDTYLVCARHEHRVCSVAYSPNGKLIASGSDDGTVILWDINKKEPVHHFKQPTLGIRAVAFSNDGKYLAAGGEDQVVYVWDLKATDLDKRCLELGPQEYTGLAGGIRSVTFSPDSQYVVSGGLDEMIRIGDLQQMDELSQLGELEAGVLKPLIQRDRPYENIEIKGIKGLNNLQMANLISLGAISRQTSLLN